MVYTAANAKMNGGKHRSVNLNANGCCACGTGLRSDGSSDSENVGLRSNANGLLNDILHINLFSIQT